MSFYSSAYPLDSVRLDPLTNGTTARAYLIGLSTFQQQPLLGSYQQGLLCLNDCGLIVADEWVRSATGRKGITLDTLLITPTGLSGIVFLQGANPIGISVLEPLVSQKPWLLSSFIAGFKAAAAKRINLCRNQLGQSVWQRNYDEMLILDETQLANLRDQLQGTAGQVLDAGHDLPISQL